MTKYRSLIIFIVLLIIIAIPITFYNFLIKSSVLCSTRGIINDVLPLVCKEANVIYRTEQIKNPYSNFCINLCSINVNISCHTYHLNKAHVFTITYPVNNDLKKAVVKSVIEEEQDEEAYWYQVETSPYIPSEEELNNMVNVHINSFIGRRFDETLQNMTSLMTLSNEENLEIHRVFWNFLYDHEFLTAYLFENYEVFPRIYGTCRKFYAVEYARPLIQNALLPITILWDERLKKAIELVDFIKRIDSMWYEPIHLCDVKHDHFGWNEQGRVRFLDLDCVITDSALKTIMLSTPNCFSDEDCSYFDCYGHCLPSKRCSGKRSNTNLQSLCYKMFLGLSDTSVIPLSGLLKSGEASTELNEVLELCITNPGMTTEVFVEALEKELLESLASHNEL